MCVAQKRDPIGKIKTNFDEVENSSLKSFNFIMSHGNLDESNISELDNDNKNNKLAICRVDVQHACSV